MAATGAGAEVATPPPIARQIDPDAGLTAAFDHAFSRYLAAQTAIKGLT
jgi:xylulokinase